MKIPLDEFILVDDIKVKQLHKDKGNETDRWWSVKNGKTWIMYMPSDGQVYSLEQLVQLHPEALI